MPTPTNDNRVEALRRLVHGLGCGDDANQLAHAIANLHVRHNTFPGEVFLEVAVDALAVAGVDRQHRIDHHTLLSSHLPEVEFRGKQHRYIQYTVHAAFASHGGLDLDLLDDVSFWIEQYWQYALFAAIAIVRACAARSGQPTATFVAELAARHQLDLA